MKDRNKQTRMKSERAQGDLILYFCLHNLISVFFFFLFTIRMGIYAGQDLMLMDIVRQEFWEVAILQVFPLSVICSLLGRIGAYYIIKLQYKYKDRKKMIKRSTKRWSELNKGMNRLGLAFLICALLTSFFYTLGMVGLLQYLIFNEETLLSLIIIYIGIKVTSYFIVNWFVGAKL